MCYRIKSANYTVGNYEILKNKVNASKQLKKWKQCVTELNQVIYTVGNYELLKNKVNAS